MNDSISSSNFSFLKEINNDLFELIDQAESLAKIDYTSSGQFMRQSCEIFVRSVIESHRLSKYLHAYETLFHKLSSLRNEDFLKDIGFLKEGQTLTDHPLLPNLGKLDYVSNCGLIFRDVDYYTFLVRFGNACSRNKQQAYSPVINFENVDKALKGYLSLYSQYYLFATNSAAKQTQSTKHI